MPRILINELEIHLAHPAPALDGFRICHFSDLHAVRFGPLEQEAVRLLSDIDADIAAYTGDLNNGSNDLSASLPIMTAVKPRLGSFAVYGNNEHNRGVNLEKTTRSLQEYGITVLNNDRVYLQDPGLWVIGVDDPFQRKDDLDRAARDIPPDQPSILLAHSPDIVPGAVSMGIDLVLAGHTHGGQVNLPGGKVIWAHCRMGRKFAAGYLPPQKLHQYGLDGTGNTHLIVNRGIGTSLIPIRLFCPPEIIVITLRSSR